MTKMHERPPGANRRANNSISTVLEHRDLTAGRDALQARRDAWLRRRGVDGPLATIVATIAFPEREAR